jgi:hypothetical protein
MSPDIVKISMRAGSSLDEAEGRQMPTVAEFDLEGFYEPPIPNHMELVRYLREEGLDPWEAVSTRRNYFANASVESFALIVSLCQSVAPVITDATAQIVAERIIRAVWRWLPIRPWESRSPVALVEASRRAQEYFVWRERLSPDDVEELAGQQVEDGFAFTVRNKQTGEVYAVRCASDGQVLARISLTLLDSFRRQ